MIGVERLFFPFCDDERQGAAARLAARHTQTPPGHPTVGHSPPKRPTRRTPRPCAPARHQPQAHPTRPFSLLSVSCNGLSPSPRCPASGTASRAANPTACALPSHAISAATVRYLGVRQTGVRVPKGARTTSRPARPSARPPSPAFGPAPEEEHCDGGQRSLVRSRCSHLWSRYLLISFFLFFLS